MQKRSNLNICQDDALECINLSSNELDRILSGSIPKLSELTDDDIQEIAKVLADSFVHTYEDSLNTEEPDDQTCIVVNLFGAPGSGKSTGAAYIFSYLKSHGVDAELVTEFAKDMVWEGRADVLRGGNQAYIFGEQLYRMNRCKDKVKVIVTDSPIPLSIIYNTSDSLGEEFNQVVMNCFNEYCNLSYFLLRDKPYNTHGRVNTEDESDQIMEKIVNMLGDRKIPHVYAKGDAAYYHKIAEEVLTVVNGETSVADLMNQGRVAL